MEINEIDSIFGRVFSRKKKKEKLLFGKALNLDYSVRFLVLVLEISE